MLILFGCEETPWNNPYPFDNAAANTLYLSFSERPKHLDPARSYSETEWRFICQIYEPPLEYHYLKRPYQLQPLTAVEMPMVRYFNEKGELLNENADVDSIAISEYQIQIKPNIFYQPHPAFAQDKVGKPLYLNLTEKEAKKYRVLSDFKEVGTKELTAEDYVYQIKRLADPNLNSPIFGLMSKYIVDLAELRATIEKTKSENSKLEKTTLEEDLKSYPFAGAEVIDRYSYRIRIKGKYPQFRFWLAMPFFSPVPWEVARFYAQPRFVRQNLTLDWYPVGTGPFQLTVNNPDRRMVLDKNPNFRGQLYPSEGQENDMKTGILLAANSEIPSIAKVNYTLETESIPFWNKFLQGYYDLSGISSDNFTSAVQFTSQGAAEITDRLKAKQIRLQTSVTPSFWSWGFNMLDDTVGGNSEKALALRRAISLGIDVQDYIDIFLNGRGILAKGPIPPDIFGYEAEQVEEDPALKKMIRKSRVEQAKKLLKQAKIPEGSVIYLDVAISGGPDEIATHAWFSEQFASIGLKMIMRGSQYNRFQEKLLQGTAQMFFWGWNADYPDPENFLFLFYGPNGAAKHGGENVTNYQHAEYDKLFEKMKSMPDSPERLAIIQKMLNILNQDQPAVWGFFPQSYALYHHWMRVSKPSGIINNTLKYTSLNPDFRLNYRLIWNQPILWPLWLLIIGLIFICIAVVLRMIEKDQSLRGKI